MLHKDTHEVCFSFLLTPCIVQFEFCWSVFKNYWSYDIRWSKENKLIKTEFDKGWKVGAQI